MHWHWRKMARKSISEGGSSSKNFKNFIKQIKSCWKCKPSADIPLQSSIIVLFFIMNMVPLERETGDKLWVNNGLDDKRLSPCCRFCHKFQQFHWFLSGTFLFLSFLIFLVYLILINLVWIYSGHGLPTITMQVGLWGIIWTENHFIHLTMPVEKGNLVRMYGV